MRSPSSDTFWGSNPLFFYFFFLYREHHISDTDTFLKGNKVIIFSESADPMSGSHLSKKYVTSTIVLLILGVPIVQGTSLDSQPSILIDDQKAIAESDLHEISYTNSPFVAKQGKTRISSDTPVYASIPDWVSGSPDYSTGGAFADFNNDNWLDFVVSDGNDMGQGHVRVYLNDGNGHLPTIASWESADVAYNGHLDVADIDGDGWIDVAVSFLGTASSFGPIARIYMNNNGVLSSTPSWSATINGNAFGVDFGDMNNDGRPDLAVATGWSYNSYHYHTYVYLNTDGTYGSIPTWQSADQNIYMSVLWVDADDDGWLDLASIGDSCQTQIYRNLGGILETTASWYTTDSANQFGIMLTAGDVTGDGIRDLFATDNTQLGGDGFFKQYTGRATGFFESTHSWGFFGDFGSAVALADVNGDHLLDLATGTWWSNTDLFLNQGTGLPAIPSWSSAYATVNEKIIFGNIGPAFYEEVCTEHFSPQGSRRLFYLPHRQIQGINSVVCDGTPLEPSEYTSSREEGWVSVSTIPTMSLNVTYRYSDSQDMAVTNWDDDIGNYLYYNQLFNSTPPPQPHPDLNCIGSLNWVNIKPGSTVFGSFTVVNQGDPGSLLTWGIVSTPDWGNWTFTPSSGSNLPSGESVTVSVRIIVPNEDHMHYQGNVTVINSYEPSDSCVLPVSLNTPYSSFLFTGSFLRPSIVLTHLHSIAYIFQTPHR